MESGDITSFRALEPVKVQFAIKQPITKQRERSRHCFIPLMVISALNDRFHG